MSYRDLGKEVGELVESKQLQYGNSFGRAGHVMKCLYPKGIETHQMDDALAITRIVDKLFRIAQRKEDGTDLGGESPYKDIAGYGLLGWNKDEQNKG